MNRYYFAFATAICSFVMLAAVGCDSGPPTGEVTGTVTLDGEPLDNALVTFVPQGGGQSAMGKTDDSGKYTLHRRGEEGALVGSHKVVVTTVQDPAEAAEDVETGSDAYMQQAMGGAPSDYNQAAVQEQIPAKYNKQSELIKEVESGTNVIDLTLTTD